MTTLIFDIETNGFLEEMDRIHCIVIRNPETAYKVSCVGHLRRGEEDLENGWMAVEDGLDMLMKADTLVGHNIIAFDIPAVQKLYPWFKPKARLIDTMVLARLFWPDIKFNDDRHREYDKGFNLPPKRRGSYSLEAFGYRLGLLKDEYDGGWENWTETMQSYCEKDVAVTEALYKKALVRWGNVPTWMSGEDVRLPSNYVPYSDECVELEHRVQEIISRQVRYGFAFDERAAVDLYICLLYTSPSPRDS